MIQPQPPIAINPPRTNPAMPNIAPIFIGVHRTFGLWIGATIMDYRISLLGDNRDGAGFHEIVSLIYQNTGSIYQDMLDAGSPDALLAFIVSRINEAGKLLPPPSDDCRKVFCTGLELLPWPTPLPVCAYPTDELTAQAWLPMKLSNMSWTLKNRYLELE